MRLNPPVLLGLGALATGCDADFDAQRSDLDGFRIAGLGVHDGVASAALWSGEGFFHDEAPSLRWTLDGEVLGEGYTVEVPGDGGVLGLELTTSDGSVLQGQVTARSVEQVVELDRATHDGDVPEVLGADDLVGYEDYEEIDATPSGRPTLLTVRSDTEPAEGELPRWMVASGAGTALGLDARSATFYAEELVYDDGELESREPLGDGWYGVVGLFLDGEGGNRWMWAEVPVGIEADAWMVHEGRLIPWDGDGEPGESGLVAGTVALTDDVRGITLTDLENVEDTDQQETLTCAPSTEPFRLAWVAEGRCTRAELDGARVVVRSP